METTIKPTDCTRAANTVNAAACVCREGDDNVCSPQYCCSNAARAASGAKGNPDGWFDGFDGFDASNTFSIDNIFSIDDGFDESNAANAFSIDNIFSIDDRFDATSCFDGIGMTVNRDDCEYMPTATPLSWIDRQIASTHHQDPCLLRPTHTLKINATNNPATSSGCNK